MRDDLQKVTFNLFSDDVKRMEHLYGFGWSGQLRLILRDFLRQRDALSDKLRGVINE